MRGTIKAGTLVAAATAALATSASPANAALTSYYKPFSTSPCQGSLAITYKDGWIVPSVYASCSKPAIALGAHLTAPPAAQYPSDQFFTPIGHTAWLKRQAVVPGNYRICAYLQTTIDSVKLLSCGDKQFK